MMHPAFPAYLFGFFLILIPIGLHLLRRRVVTPVRYPSFFFLKKTAVRRQRRNNLRKFLVLLFRCLAFLCLSYAFAYPLLSNVSPAPEKATVLVLDSSFSTAPAREKMLAALKKELRGISPEHPMLVASAGGRVLWSGGFSADGAALAAWAQEQMCRPQSSSFASALAMADSRLGSIPAAEKDIVVLTDGQALPWRGVRPGTLRNASAIRVAGMPFREKTPNVAVTGAEIAGPYTHARQELLLNTVIRNFNPEPERVSLTVELAQRIVLEKEIVIPANGTFREQFRLKNDVPDFRPLPGRVMIRAEANALKADDVRYFAANPLPPPEVFLVPRSDGGTDFIPVALTSRSGETESAPVALHTFASGKAAEAARSDAVIVERADPVEEMTQLLEDLLAAGGNAAILWRNTGEMRALLKHFGFRIRRSELPGVHRLEFIDFGHRLFHDYLEVNAGAWFDILFFRIPQFAVPPGTRVIASFSGAVPAVMERKYKRGKLFVLAFSPEETRTNWQTFGNFLPFWRELVLHTGKREAVRTSLTLDGSSRVMPGEVTDLETGAATDRRLRLDKAGNYACDNRIYSVNPPARESETALLPEDFDLSGLIDRKAWAERRGAAPRSDVLAAAAAAPSSWRFWLLLALLFFLAELGLANRTVQ